MRKLARNVLAAVCFGAAVTWWTSWGSALAGWTSTTVRRVRLGWRCESYRLAPAQNAIVSGYWRLSLFAS